MGNSFTVALAIRGGYIVTEAAVRHVAEQATNFASTVPRIIITFRGGRAVESTNADDVFKDSFLLSTEIASIDIKSPFGAPYMVEITFFHDDAAPIKFYASGDREKVILFEGEFRNRLHELRAWYSPIVLSQYMTTSGQETTTAMYLLITICALIGFAFMYFSFAVTQRETIVFSGVITCISLFVLGNYLIFPAMIFDIGRGARRQLRKSIIWSFLISTIVGGIVAGLAANFFYEQLSRFFRS